MKIMPKDKLLLELMKNFIKTIDKVEAVMIYDRQGFLICKNALVETPRDGLDEREREEIYGAFTGTVEPLLKKINTKYDIGELGLITFEIKDFHLIFLEAGPEAIVLITTSYDLEINSILPYCYLVVEKIAQILEGKFDMKHNTLTIPKFEVGAYLDGEILKTAEKTGNNELVIERQKKEKYFKLIILGDPQVGKTTLVTQFVKKQYSADYRPTLGISMTTTRYYIQGFEDSLIRFIIYDLAGQEFFNRIRHIYYTNAQAVFIVYDVSRKETFDNIDKWYEDAKKDLKDIPFVLIGNKIDLEDERQVSTEEGRNKANKLKSSFIETSAKENINVQDTFKILGIGMFFKEIPDDKEPVFLL